MNTKMKMNISVQIKLTVNDSIYAFKEVGIAGADAGAHPPDGVDGNINNGASKDATATGSKKNACMHHACEGIDADIVTEKRLPVKVFQAIAPNDNNKNGEVKNAAATRSKKNANANHACEVIDADASSEKHRPVKVFQDIAPNLVFVCSYKEVGIAGFYAGADPAAGFDGNNNIGASEDAATAEISFCSAYCCN